MAVKASSTAVKVLAVLDAVARHQPVGVSELARLLQEDKATVQRMLVTLAAEGWIRPEGARQTKWAVTHRLRLLANLACAASDIVAIARPYIEALRAQTGETISLVLNDGPRFIVADVAESDALLRAVPRVGMAVPGPASASSLAYMAHLTTTRQAEILGRDPSAEEAVILDRVRRAGFASRESFLTDETVSIAAAVQSHGGEPLAVIVLTAPQSRLAVDQQHEVGRQVRDAAQSLSHSVETFGGPDGAV